MKAWRTVSRGLYQTFFGWVRTNQERRMEEGLRKYRSEIEGFKGDPLEHALEEILDALFYIYYAMRERDDYKQQLDRAIERLRSIHPPEKTDRSSGA